MEEVRHKDIFVILDNVRSVHNVGSIFRTCDAAGVAKLILCGTTPTPLDRFSRTRKDLAKVALGAEKTVLWEYFSTTEEAIRSYTKDGIDTVAVEQTENAIDYKMYTPKAPIAFVFGNEVDGVSPEVLSHCRTSISIPMHGTKESLNVSVTVGIILFSLR